MLRGDRHRALVAELPLDRLLTETDGPFTKESGRTLRPADVSSVVSMLARARSVERAVMATKIVANLQTLVSSVST